MENHSMDSTRISNTHLLKQEIINTKVSSVSTAYEPNPSSQFSTHLPLPDFGPTSSPVVYGSDGSTQKQRNQTFKDLEKSVKNYELDIYLAGEAVHNGYARSDPTVHLEVASFIDKYAGKIRSSKLPPPEPFLNPHYLYIMTHGYGVVSQLALAASHKQTPKTDAESMDLGSITGALCNIASDNNFCYPKEEPFNGEKIEFRIEMPRKLNIPAHVVIKKLLFTFLGRSCLHPTDIQTATWAIPEDAAVPRSQNPVAFPRSLYDDLQNLLLQFFRLDEDLLSRGTYIPPTMGQKYGIFKLKPHVKRQRISDDMLPEEYHHRPDPDLTNFTTSGHSSPR